MRRRLPSGGEYAILYGMKTGKGSIQRKGKRLYLVVSQHGAQKWMALKTCDIATAMERARALAPAESGDEREWLEHLVGLGRTAGMRLRELRNGAVSDWDALLQAYVERSGVADDGKGQPFARWLALLKKELGGLAPDAADAAGVRRAVAALAERYVSCRRMVGFFRRCWSAAGLDASVWDLDAALRRRICENGRAREFYRRFTMDEIRRIHRHLQRSAPDLADMVAIGFMTGLRLSDVAELDTGEVAEDATALRITPNKTRRRKSRPLQIPLVHEAAAAVARRVALVCAGCDGGRAPFGANKANGGRYLFPEEVRHRPSRHICSEICACGIVRGDCARASFHSLRATFISMMDEAGVSPHVTDAITGHGGGGMHARYTQPSRDAMRRAILSAIPPLGLQKPCTSQYIDSAKSIY